MQQEHLRHGSNIRQQLAFHYLNNTIKILVNYKCHISEFRSNTEIKKNPLMWGHSKEHVLYVLGVFNSIAAAHCRAVRGETVEAQAPSMRQ